MLSVRSWRVIAATFAVLLLLSASGIAQANKVDTFVQLDKELRLMHDQQLFKGGKTKQNTDGKDVLGKGEPVVFDSDTARREGFSEQSIALAEQLATFTNEILRPVTEQQPSIALMSSVHVRYPALAAYFAAAAEASKQPPLQTQVIGQTVCGWYTNPRPSQAAPWRQWYSDNPDATLRSWGYHSTPDLVGGGYTRAQTWSWLTCGFGTFRDHAYVAGERTFYEQNYEGWSPRGEPNPEVYASGPWPYADWPAYVYWWHSTH